MTSMGSSGGRNKKNMKLRAGLPILGVVLLLTGCLSKLESMTEETKDWVKESVHKINETETATRLSTALNLLFNEDNSESIRSAAAETMFIYAEPDRLYKYIGATLPLNYYMGIGNKFPNVSFVGTKSDVRKNLSPVSPNTYKILEMASMRVLRELALKANTQLTSTELDDIKSKTMRMFVVSTAVLGALPGPVAKDADRAEVEAALEEQKDNQVEAAEKLMSLTTLFNDDIKAKVKTMIEVRFHSTKPVSPAFDDAPAHPDRKSVV